MEIINELSEPSLDGLKRIEDIPGSHIKECDAIEDNCRRPGVESGRGADICGDVAGSCGRFTGNCDWIIDTCGCVRACCKRLASKCESVAECCGRITGECE